MQAETQILTLESQSVHDFEFTCGYYCLMKRVFRFENSLVQILLILATLLITPWWAIEPINAVKFQVIVVFGFVAAALILSNLEVVSERWRHQKVTIVLSLCFTLGILSTLMISRLDWRQQLYGALGRNLGVLAYLSIIFVFLYVVLLTDHSFDSVVLKALLTCGALSSFYGLLQSAKFDPIGWNNKYNSQIGFLGNPNFQSAFLGIYSIMLTHILLNKGKRLRTSLAILMSLVLNLFLILTSDSIQGVYVFSAGAIVLFLDKLYQSKFKSLTVPTSLLLVGGVSIATLGLLQKGPFSFLYQPSISFRGDYWRAGLNMFRDSPVYGFGQSSFGEYYLLYRDSFAMERRLDGTVTNSAHNILIDLAATGGIILVVPFLTLLLYTLYVFLRVYKSDYRNETNIVLFFALWVGFLSQAVISVQFLPITLWGWIFMGIILRAAFDISHRVNSSGAKHPKKIKLEQVALKKSPSLIIWSSTIVAILIGSLPLKASIEEKSAYESKNLDRIINSAYVEIQDPRRFLTIAAYLLRNGYPDQALSLASDAVRLNSRETNAWKIIAYLSPEGSIERFNANSKLLELDPLGFKVNR
jgi:O-antigen ligase